MRARRRDDRGVTTVEFALVLPIFLAVVGIGAYFAWMFYVQAQVNRAADRAARYAVVPYTATTVVTKNIDQNGNVHVPGVTLTTGLVIANAYQTTETTTTYHFCPSEVVAKINKDLFTGSVTASDVQVSDGSKDASGNPKGPLAANAACTQPSGYVRVQITKDFTNPFAFVVAPFTGGSSKLQVTGTGRARVEAE